MRRASQLLRPRLRLRLWGLTMCLWHHRRRQRVGTLRRVHSPWVYPARRKVLGTVVMVAMVVCVAVAPWVPSGVVRPSVQASVSPAGCQAGGYKGQPCRPRPRGGRAQRRRRRRRRLRSGPSARIRLRLPPAWLTLQCQWRMTRKRPHCRVHTWTMAWGHWRQGRQCHTPVRARLGVLLCFHLARAPQHQPRLQRPSNSCVPRCQAHRSQAHPQDKRRNRRSPRCPRSHHSPAGSARRRRVRRARRRRSTSTRRRRRAGRGARRCLRWVRRAQRLAARCSMRGTKDKCTLVLLQAVLRPPRPRALSFVLCL